jgi:hypothetical protein
VALFYRSKVSAAPSRDYTDRKGPRKGPKKGPRKDVEGRSDANAATFGHQHRAAREAAVLVAETADAATVTVLADIGGL